MSILKENLTDLEVLKIEAFCKDESMFNAVEKVLFAIIYSDGAIKKGNKLNKTNGAFHLLAQASAQGKEISSEALGDNLRAIFEGVHTVMDGFAQLKTIKSTKDVEEASPYKEAK